MGYGDGDWYANGYGGESDVAEGYEDQPPPYDGPPQGYGDGQGYGGPQGYGPGITAEAQGAYGGSGLAERQVQPTPPQEASAVTLVFKDGRPRETIHNYALTRTMLYVTDGRRQEIPVASLDLAATERVNRAAGVQFQLPVAQ